MLETGFSIRCPHCFEWSDWPDTHPRDVVISIDEQQDILRRLKDDPGNFLYEKMLKCQNSACPAPFQCLVCENPKSAHGFVKGINTWTLPRAFRLYKTKYKERWIDYSGVLFCAQPVMRQKNIFLEELLDRELLSRATLGMSLELRSVFTVFAANFIDSENSNPFWVPVESYTENVRNIPPRYNIFCKICRNAIMKVLLKNLKKEITDQPCKLCLGSTKKHRDIKPACQKDDWNRCPRYLAIRKEKCLCYKSDYKAIRVLEEEWGQGRITDCDCIQHTCWAGFKEISSPIIVHNHLVGVAMSGQFITDINDLPDINALVEKYPVLAPYKNALVCVEKIYRGERKPKTELQNYTKRLLITNENLAKKAQLLAENARRIAQVAETRYRELRFRLESVFKEELLGRINLVAPQSTSFRDSLLEILHRMREFWAFKAVYFLHCPPKTGTLSLMAYCNKKGQSKYLANPKELGYIESTAFPTHPIPWLWDPERKEEFEEPWLQALVKIFQQVIQKSEIPISLGRYYFIVLIPFREQIYAFLFAVRDETAVSPLRSLQKGTISSLCQQAILETCTETIERLLEMRYQETILKTRIDAWRSISARTAHKINNWLFVARGALRRQYQKDANYEGMEDILRAIGRIGEVSNDFVRFNVDQPLKLIPVDIKTFINDEIALHQQAIQGQNVSISMSDYLPECYWDTGQISQLLAELLENAVYYTPAGGNINVSVQSFEKSGSDMIKIVVENDGPGIQPADKMRIFEPFFSNRADGTGLGLAIVEKIVKSHSGHIYENGQPGKTARFVVELPTKLHKETL